MQPLRTYQDILEWQKNHCDVTMILQSGSCLSLALRWVSTQACVCTLNWEPSGNGSTQVCVVYSRKLSREKTFANWWKIWFSQRKLSQIAGFCHTKGRHAPNCVTLCDSKFLSPFRLLKTAAGFPSSSSEQQPTHQVRMVSTDTGQSSTHCILARVCSISC